MIEIMRSRYGVRELCEALEVTSSGYYKWRQKKKSARADQNQTLLKEIKMIHLDKHMKSYGSPRMTSELNARGFQCSRNRVARLMSSAGISARHTPKWKPNTTVQNPRHQPSENHLKEVHEVAAPGQIWVSDITYVFTRSQTCYLAVVMDLFTRRIVGWEFDTHMESSLVLKAMKQAEAQQPLTTARIFHSDRGSQYSSHLIRDHLKQKRYQQSMSALGYCYDNAACESFFATLKKESFPINQTFETPSKARCEIFEYLEGFYNSRRLHSSLGMKSPNEFHQLYLQSN